MTEPEAFVTMIANDEALTTVKAIGATISTSSHGTRVTLGNMYGQADELPDALRWLLVRLAQNVQNRHEVSK